MNRRFKNYAFVAAVIVGVTLVACGGESSSAPAPASPTSASEPTRAAAPTSAPAPSETANAVKTEIIDFTLLDLTIPVGTTVTWVNLDALPHTTTAEVSPDRSGEWDSGSLSSSSEFSFTFNEVGTIPYFCTIHPFMTATVTVIALDSSIRTSTPVLVASTAMPEQPAPAAMAVTPTPVSPTQTPVPTETTQVSEPTAISSEILNFELEDLTIVAGTTVTWINGDKAAHTTTAGVSPTSSGEWDSSSMSQGAQFSFTFHEAGSFPYFCAIHPSMTATITVTGPPS